MIYNIDTPNSLDNITTHDIKFCLVYQILYSNNNIKERGDAR
nr:MAG TPA: hypothetical protein [Caudoviricetes sp.]